MNGMTEEQFADLEPGDVILFAWGNLKETNGIGRVERIVNMAVPAYAHIRIMRFGKKHRDVTVYGYDIDSIVQLQKEEIMMLIGRKTN